MANWFGPITIPFVPPTPVFKPITPVAVGVLNPSSPSHPVGWRTPRPVNIITGTRRSTPPQREPAGGLHRY
jgi:hypothetical protein